MRRTATRIVYVLSFRQSTHRRLRELARQQGGGHAPDERLATLRAIEGLWRNRRDIGNSSAYVRRLRRDTRRLRPAP